MPSSATIVAAHTALTFDVAGQLTDVSYPGGITEHTTYDAEGLTATRTVGTSAGPFIADTLTYDPLGRITVAQGRVVKSGFHQTIWNTYAGLGALAEMEQDFQFGTPKLEEFRSDALGNQVETRRYNVRLAQGVDNPQIRYSDYEANGRLHLIHQHPDSLLVQEYNQVEYDAFGRNRLNGVHTFTSGGVYGPTQEDRAQSVSYYDGDGRLALFERHLGPRLQDSVRNDPRALTERYRYDALGRRVLVRTLRKADWCNAAGCEPTIQRFVWDGDQLLYETRGRADTTDSEFTLETDSPSGTGVYTAPNAYGVVGYTHAGGIDRPLGIMRRNTTSGLVAFYPHLNWRGLYETGTDDAGARITNNVSWPGASASAYLGATPTSTPYEWFGSLVTEQADASGLMYRRNRYYDPKTGRFTSSDPIGVAGGLNGYNFGASDPLAYRDPFGLSVCSELREQMLEVAVELDGYIGRYVGHFLDGDADYTHQDQIEGKRRNIERLKRRYYRQEKCDKNDEDDHDDWMNGPGVYVEMMLTLPLPGWQVDNRGSPHGPGPKGHRSAQNGIQKSQLNTLGKAGWTALAVAVGAYLAARMAPILIP